uniref:Aminotransferase-like plant mobile domain-containing protein n=1 Tax=Asparagus officinalis TaxID=4686 RepID=Q2AA21_ASPOF|nr:hypothetical protein 20.t00006 [Asparagus officinalis]
MIKFPQCSTLRILITDLDLETPVGHAQFPKPAFIFRDRVPVDDHLTYVEDSKLLWRADNSFLFLLNMKRMYPLSYFLNMSCRRGLTFDIVKEKENVSLGFGRRARTQIGEQLKGLKPDVQVPWMGLFSGEGGWWTRMVDFVLEELKDSLAQSGLTVPVLATRRGVVQSLHNFFAMLEKYNPDSCTFFTPAGELGFALHEMQAVSGLSLGKTPYEGFIPTTEELSLLKVAHPEIYATFWELMCHFNICAQVFGMRGGIMHTTWADYLFQNLNRKDVAVSRVAVVSLKDAKARIKAPGATYKTEHAEDDFEASVEFESFHYQATVPISDTALLAGFFMIWLKRCVVPSRPIESILAEVVYPAVLLAHGRPVSLLTAMVGCIQNGLRVLTSELFSASGVKATKKKAGKAPQPRVPMPYTYLVAWFMLHCPSLMTGVHEGDDAYTPFVQSFDGADVENARFMDLLFEGSSSLEEGTFSWLLMIRLGYLVYRSREKYIIEPYMPSRFARQFVYDQLYVGNPNPALAQIGNLYEGARAWYFFSAGGTHAQFTLPNSPPGCSAVMDFRQWFAEASHVSEYDVYTSCINEIRELYRSRSGSASTRLPGMEEYLSCANQQRAPKQYSFKEEHVDTLFQLLRKNNKLQLPEIRKPDEAGKVDDPNYCRYHRFLGHPTKKCYVFKDILQNLVNANVLTLKPEQKTVSTNMIAVQFGDFPPVVTANGVIPIRKGEMHLKNVDPHSQKDRGLVPLTTQKGEIMWVHPDLLRDQQWTSTSSKKKGGKAKSSNMISPSITENDDHLKPLTDSEEERIALAAYPGDNPGTRSGKTYLRDYGQNAPEVEEQPQDAGGSAPKKPVDKGK